MHHHCCQQHFRFIGPELECVADTRLELDGLETRHVVEPTSGCQMNSPAVIPGHTDQRPPNDVGKRNIVPYQSLISGGISGLLRREEPVSRILRDIDAKMCVQVLDTSQRDNTHQ